MDMKKIVSTSGRKQPTAISRMKQDYMRLKRDPLPYITAEPLPNNMLEWHYCVKGPEDSPYYGGFYHGTLLFPREFPFKPPSIYMLTPNGRFKTNTRLCLSISDFHPDTWNPTWCVGTILTGLLSFMLETTPTLGSIESTVYEKQQYAKKSIAFNLKNQNFRELFPEICEEMNQRQQQQQQQFSQTSNEMIVNGSVSCNNVKNGLTDFNKVAANGDILNPNDLNVNAPKQNFNMNNNNNINNKNKGSLGTNSPKNSYFNWQSIYSNLVIMLSFAIFALIVNYVIKNINQE